MLNEYVNVEQEAHGDEDEWQDETMDSEGRAEPASEVTTASLPEQETQTANLPDEHQRLSTMRYLDLDHLTTADLEHFVNNYTEIKARLEAAGAQQ